jgi:hypothetical protein
MAKSLAVCRAKIGMIAGDVEKKGDLGMEFLHPLELETAHLGDDPVRILRAFHVFDQRGADIASDKDLYPGRPEHLADERCDSRFPIGSGDGRQRRLQEAPGHFHFAQDRDLPP